MRVLIGCEHSGVLRDAWIRAGHDAVSCDLLPSDSDFGPHVQCDVMEVLDWGWDLAIFHPTCTYLTNSAVNILFQPQHRYPNSLVEDARFDAAMEAAHFFYDLLHAPIPRICVENPVMHQFGRMVVGRQTQVVQPWWFGDDASKATALWLRNLPPLVPTQIIKKARYANQTKSGWNKLSQTANRWKERSKTYQGMADAMVTQWGLSDE